ncbi:MAG: hypothetical protein KDN22_21870 [Verrucomicrobiae bacterium]|nr:hypothetical protein [Verrucomicrobiae bacterium]
MCEKMFYSFAFVLLMSFTASMGRSGLMACRTPIGGEDLTDSGFAGENAVGCCVALNELGIAACGGAGSFTSSENETCVIKQAPDLAGTIGWTWARSLSDPVCGQQLDAAPSGSVRIMISFSSSCWHQSDLARVAILIA